MRERRSGTRPTPEYQRAWYRANRERLVRLNVANQRRRKYGLEPEEYDAMVAARVGRCDICGEQPDGALCVDHDHGTGQVRGLLCQDCNKGLGCFRDNPVFIERANDYLQEKRA